ncbi:hypothetical protein CL622_00260 [archaeon]|nr:hypothetical protein [archaeon]
MKPVPEPFTSTDSIGYQDKIDTFFIETRDYLRQHYEPKSLSFEIKSGEIVYPPSKIGNDRVTYLTCDDLIVAHILEVRDQHNYTQFVFSRDLRKFKIPKNVNEEGKIEPFLTDAKNYLLSKYNLNGPYFETKAGEIVYHFSDTTNNTNDQVTYLTCKGFIVAHVLAMRNEQNYTQFIFSRELRGFDAFEKRRKENPPLETFINSD